MNLIRVIQLILQELRRSQPHGLVSWRYLALSDDSRLYLHHLLWIQSLPGWPRPLWLVIELWLWLRWVFYYAWRASWRSVRHLGPEVREQEGISLWSQGVRVLGLALGWCILPRDSYRFRLYRSPQTALDFIYDHELQAYHRWQNEKRGLTRESSRLLQDKWYQTQALAVLGVPMASILACVRQNAQADFEVWLEQEPRLFCKSRSGNQGRGAFAMWRAREGYVGRRFDGKVLDSKTEVDSAWQTLLGMDDVLVQPCLRNHPGLEPLAVDGLTITVRFISRWQDGRLVCLCSTLEIPAGYEPNSGHVQYVFLEIEPDSGRLRPMPDDALPRNAARVRQAKVMALIEDDAAVPYWPELVEASYRAHKVFPDVWAIAWDWVVTAEGPMLLEGNSGWGAVIPQLLRGGFVEGRDVIR